jgi:hypothetical protein
MFIEYSTVKFEVSAKIFMKKLKTSEYKTMLKNEKKALLR